VIMHVEQSGTRYLWFGFDPDSLTQDDRQLMILVHTAFRWVAGQPVSEGAAGAPQLARTMTADARVAAQTDRFVFSVDPLRNPNVLSVRMTNRGANSVENPTVEVWLPPRVSSVDLGGDYLMKHKVTLTKLPNDSACLLSLPDLAPHEDRVIRLKLAIAPAADAVR
ncbi:MAG TPA: hypothetical protein VNN08_25155, partial [Thermoanaerobaculia bacterium]|nr:hypothetical protein [Thermoanaerobaculia bacterium]